MNSEANSACIIAGVPRPSVKRTREEITTGLEEDFAEDSESDIAAFTEDLDDNDDEEDAYEGPSPMVSSAKLIKPMTSTSVSGLASVSSPVTSASILPSILAEKKKKKKSRHALSPTKAVAPLVKSWLLTHYDVGTAAEGYSVPRSALYDHFVAFADRANIRCLNAATFGKLMRWICPDLKTRRLGTRGASKYHYYGIKPKANLNLAAATAAAVANAANTNANPIVSTTAAPMTLSAPNNNMTASPASASPIGHTTTTTAAAAAAAAILNTPPPPANIAIQVEPPRKRQRTNAGGAVATTGAASGASAKSSSVKTAKGKGANGNATPVTTVVTAPCCSTKPSATSGRVVSTLTTAVPVKPPSGFVTSSMTPVSVNKQPSMATQLAMPVSCKRAPMSPSSTLSIALVLDLSAVETAGDAQLAAQGLCGLALEPATILIKKYRDHVRTVATAIASGRFLTIEAVSAKFWVSLPYHLAHRYLAVPGVASALAAVDEAAFAALGQSLIAAAAEDGTKAVDTAYVSQLLSFCGQWEGMVARALEGPPPRASVAFITAARENASRHGRTLGAAAQVALLAGEAATMLHRAGQPQQMLADWVAAGAESQAAGLEVERLLARAAPVGDWLEWVRVRVAEPAAASPDSCRDALGAWQLFVGAALGAISASTAAAAAFHVLFSLLNQYVIYFLEANSGKISCIAPTVEIKAEPSIDQMDQSDVIILGMTDVPPIEMGMMIDAALPAQSSIPATSCVVIGDDSSLECCFEPSRFEPTPIPPSEDSCGVAPPLLSCAFMPAEVDVDMSVADDNAVSGFGSYGSFDSSFSSTAQVSAASAATSSMSSAATTGAAASSSFLAQLDAFFETSNPAPATTEGLVAY